MTNLKNKKKNWFLVWANLCLLGLWLLIISNTVNWQGMNFGWIEDVQEVVEKAVFTNTWQTDVIAEMEINDAGALEIKSTVIVSWNGNQVSATNSHILWWEWNKVKSENVTILGWKDLKVENLSINSTIVWWKWNEVKSERSVIIWWEWNVTSGGETSSIVWWSGNVVQANRSTVLWSDNTVQGNDVIVAWKKVTVDTSIENIFVFSNRGNFAPQSSKTFYMNVGSGVWLNGDSAKAWISSHWAIKVWYVDIADFCKGPKIWVQWIAMGSDCLVWCTESYSTLAQQYKRSLLDKSQRCIDWCDLPSNRSRCVLPGDDDVIYTWYLSFCTGNNSILQNIQSGHLTYCWGTDTSNYSDVIFSYDIVDRCPDGNNIENPCTFTCGEGTTWGKKSEGSEEYWCWKSCIWTLDGIPETRRNGEMVRRYISEEPTCNSAGNLCGSRSQFKRRKCENWTWVPAWGDHTKRAYYDSCIAQASPEWYCKKSDGELDFLYKYDIEPNEIQESAAIYEKCDTYTVENESACVEHSHYMFVSCKTWYTMDSDPNDPTKPVCQPDCDFHWIKVPYGQSITGYESSQITCTWTNSQCKAGILTCQKWWTFWSEINFYPEASCALTWLSCAAWFNVNVCPDKWICDTCTGYTVNNNACQISVKKQLIDCITWYSIYTWNNTCKKDCDLPRWGSIKHWQSVDGYKSGSVTCTGYCNMTGNKVSLVCSDGKLSWHEPSYYVWYHSWCVTQPLLNKTWYDLSAEIENAICDEFTPYKVVNNQCEVQPKKYKCTGCKTGYTQMGEWNDMSCIPKCSFRAFPSLSIVSLTGWESRITYKNSSYTCPNTPETSPTLCSNGELSWGYYTSMEYNGSSYTWYYTSYTLSAKTCQTTSNVEWVKVFTNVLNNYNDKVEIYSVPCTAYPKLNETTCSNTWISYHYYKCQDWYKWNNAWTKCVKCEWEIPSNATGNNNLYPSQDSTDYHYSENINEVCSFRCNSGFIWSGGTTNKCIANSKKCTLDDGTKTYLHSATRTFYKSDSVLCNDNCESITATCNDGIWYDGTNSPVADWYTSCKTQTGKQVKYTTSDERTPKEAWECKKYNAWNSEKIRTFSGNIQAIANANKQSTCREYKPTNNAGDCDAWTTYTTFVCNGTWDWNKCIPWCTLWGETYNHWDKEYVYTGFTSCDGICKATQVTCSGWVRDYNWTAISQFNSVCTYTWTTCNSTYYNLTECPLHWNCAKCTGYTVNNNTCQSSIKYRLTGCVAWYHKSNNTCEPDDCMLPEWSWKVAHNTEVTRYKKSSLQCSSGGQACSGETRVCVAWKRYKKNSNIQSDFPSGYIYSTCDLIAKTCDTSEFNIPWRAENPWESECQSIEVQGWKCVGWDYRHSEVPHEWCYINWVEYTHWQTASFYLRDKVKCPTTCDAAWYQCQDWLWKSQDDGTTYNSSSLKTNCEVIDWDSTCGTDTSKIFDSQPSNAYYSECIEYKSISSSECSSNTKYIFKSCTTWYTAVKESNKRVCKKDCIFNGKDVNGTNVTKTIKHWSGITAYSYSYIDCLSQWRECNNGTLSGSYTRTWCPDYCANPNGVSWSTARGSDLTLFNQVQCPNNCSSQTRTCFANGSWSAEWGTEYKYTSCQKTATTCDSSYTIAEDQKDTNAEYDETQCYTSNGSTCTLKKMYKFKSCKSWYTEVTEDGKKVCKAWCTLPRWWTTGHNKTVTAYKSPHECTDGSTQCEKETRTCNNGKWYDGNTQKDFTLTGQTCVLKQKTCESHTLTSNGNSNCNYDKCTPYNVNWSSCNQQNPMYKITSAKEGYYVEGDSCLDICGVTTCRNTSKYTVSAVTRGNWYTKWWNKFKCTNTNNSNDNKTCDCPNDYVWNASEWECVKPSNNLCDLDNYSYGVSNKGCNTSFKENEIEITDASNSSIIAWYKWTCKNERGSDNCIICINGYTKDGNTCVKNENGACAFDGNWCSAWDVANISDLWPDWSPRWKRWDCKGRGNWSSQSCRLMWNCDGSCWRDSTAEGGICGGMYNTYASFPKTYCENAWAYYTYNNYWETVGRTPCYREYELPYPNNNIMKCKDVVTAPNDGLHYAHNCFIWNANLKCDQQVDSVINTYEGTQAIQKCSAISGLKPSCISSTSSSYWRWNNSGWWSSANSFCHAYPHTAYPFWCIAVYSWGIPVTGTWIDGATSADDPKDWWSNYCNSKKSESACEAVWVATYHPTTYVTKYQAVDPLPYLYGPADVQTAKCCEWTAINY